MLTGKLLRRLSRRLRRSFQQYVVAIHTRLPHVEAARKKRERQNEAHPLLRLPAELRSRIYDFALVDGAVISPTLSSVCPVVFTGTESRQRMTYIDGSRHVSSTETNLAQVCRSLRTEALYHFYRHNMFSFPIIRGTLGFFHKPQSLPLWLRDQPPSVLPMLKILLFGKRSCPHEKAVRAAKGYEDAQRVHVGRTYNILVDFAATKELKMISSRGPERSEWSYIHLDDCEICWQKLLDDVQTFQESEIWKEARDVWHDKLDGGKLSWRDVARMIKIVRTAFQFGYLRLPDS